MKLKLLLAGILISKITFSQVPAYVPTNGLVGWWPFTGNANDVSGNNNNGIVSGATLTTDRFGSINSAYNFNGTTNYIYAANNSSLNVNSSTSLSISAWVKLNGSQIGYSGIMCKMDASGNGCQFMVGNVSGTNRLSTETGQGAMGASFLGNQNINDNLWHHVVYVLDRSSGTITFYIDGNIDIQVQNAGLLSADLTNTANLLIGMDRTTNYHFKGVIDDVGRWNRALTSCEVSELFNSQVLSSSGTDVVSSCNSYTWIDGNTYTSSNNTATHVLTNVAGCDSTVTLNLTINNSNSGTDIVTECNSYTWIDGNTYTSSNNTATYTLTNVAGCDSIVTLNLTINPSSSGTDVVDACDTYTWIDGITYTSSNSTATYILQNSHGCDSLVTLNLTLNNSSSSTLNETALDSYTLNGQTYTQSGTYTQTLTNSQGCDSTITLNLELQFTGIQEPIEHLVSVYPNPAIESITIESKSFDDVFVLDLLGNIIIQETKNDSKKVVSLINLSSGTYFIRQDASIFKFIKQ